MIEHVTSEEEIKYEFSLTRRIYLNDHVEVGHSNYKFMLDSMLSKLNNLFEKVGFDTLKLAKVGIEK